MILGYSGDKEDDFGGISHLGGGVEKERKRVEEKRLSHYKTTLKIWHNSIAIKSHHWNAEFVPLSNIRYINIYIYFFFRRRFYCFLSHKGKCGFGWWNTQIQSYLAHYWLRLHLRRSCKSSALLCSHHLNDLHHTAQLSRHDLQSILFITSWWALLNFTVVSFRKFLWMQYL